MKHTPTFRRKRRNTKSVLRLPDLEHAKSAVLNSLNSADAKRGYRHAIDEFVDWYCSKSRVAFNRIVVLRYRSHLESGQLAPGTINLRLGVSWICAFRAITIGVRALSASIAPYSVVTKSFLSAPGVLMGKRQDGGFSSKARLT